MFGFETAEVGKTVHVRSDFYFGRSVTTSTGRITNVARNAAGVVEIIYANVAGLDVVLGRSAVLTVTP